MKRVLILLAFLISGIGFAQDNTVKSTYERSGDLVTVTNYYEDGSIKEQGFYKDKKLHGEWKKYDSEGTLVVRAHYFNGEKTGKWMFLNDNTLTEVDYQDNKVASVHEWNSNVASN